MYTKKDLLSILAAGIVMGVGFAALAVGAVHLKETYPEIMRIGAALVLLTAFGICIVFDYKHPNHLSIRVSKNQDRSIEENK